LNWPPIHLQEGQPTELGFHRCRVRCHTLMTVLGKGYSDDNSCHDLQVTMEQLQHHHTKARLIVIIIYKVSKFRNPLFYFFQLQIQKGKTSSLKNLTNNHKKYNKSSLNSFKEPQNSCV